jgi:hypothetical protein
MTELARVPSDYYRRVVRWAVATAPANTLTSQVRRGDCDPLANAQNGT